MFRISMSKPKAAYYSTKYDKVKSDTANDYSMYHSDPEISKLELSNFV